MSEIIDLGLGRVARQRTPQRLGPLADKSIELRHLTDEVLTSLNSLDLVVGSPSDVETGRANFTSIQSAHDALTGPGTIKLLNGTFLENISWSNNRATLVGQGNGSEISGAFTIDGDSNLLKHFRLAGDLIINGDKNIITEAWQTAANTVTNNGTDNIYTLIDD